MRVSIPATKFALAPLFERIPDVRVEHESAVAAPSDHGMLIVRTDADDRDVLAALQADSTVETVETLSDHADSWTYRIAWAAQPRRLVERLVAADVTLLSARAQNGRWRFRLLTTDRDGISRAHEIMTEHGCNPDCLSISTADGAQSDQYGLTNVQRETLVEAFSEGYYDIPRGSTAKELAKKLDISHQALSERLRRATKSFLESQLITSTNVSQ